MWSANKLSHHLGMEKPSLISRAYKLGFKPRRIGNESYYTEIQAKAIISFKTIKRLVPQSTATNLIVDYFFNNPERSIIQVAKDLRISYGTVSNAISKYFASIEKQPVDYEILPSRMNFEYFD